MTQAAAGRHDVKALQAVLEQVALERLNVQAVVIEPATRVIHLSTKSRPAARGPYSRLDLGPWLAAPIDPAAD